MKKVCSKCGVEKYVEEFAIRTDSGKRRDQCRKCVSERRSKHFQNNKEKILAAQKEHYEENKEIILARNREYYFEHIGEIRENKRKLMAYNRATDPAYKVRMLVGKSIRRALLLPKGG